LSAISSIARLKGEASQMRRLKGNSPLEMEDAMSQIGLNHRLSVARTFKQQTRTLYEGVLGATVMSPRPDAEIFTFTNGSGIGVFYVDPREALTPEQHLKAIWLEFEVADETATVTRLEALGMLPFEYFDKAHKYFQAPGGQVFRLAQH
jgi:hypothetical protein